MVKFLVLGALWLVVATGCADAGKPSGNSGSAPPPASPSAPPLLMGGQLQLLPQLFFEHGSIIHSPDLSYYVALEPLTADTFTLPNAHLVNIASGTIVARFTSATGARFSPDSKFLIVYSEDKGTKVFDVAANVEALTALGKYQDIIFSADSSRAVVIALDNSITLIDSRTGVRIASYRFSSTNIIFSPDGHYFLAYDRFSDGTLLVESPRGAVLIENSPSFGEIHATFSANSKYLAISRRGFAKDPKNHVLEIYYLSGALPKLIFTASDVDFGARQPLEFSPDGSLLAFARSASSGERSLGLIFLKGGIAAEASPLPGFFPFPEAFSGNSKFLVVREGKRGLKIFLPEENLYIYQRTLSTDSLKAFFSPDNAWFVTLNQGAQILDLATGKYFPLVDAKATSMVSFSENGKYLATISRGDRVRFFEFAAKRELGVFEMPRHWYAVDVKFYQGSKMVYVKFITESGNVRYHYFKFQPH